MILESALEFRNKSQEHQGVIDAKWTARLRFARLLRSRPDWIKLVAVCEELERLAQEKQRD